MSPARSSRPHALAPSSHPFLRDFDPPFLHGLAPASQERTFAADEYLLRDGGEADGFYLLLHGKVALEIATPERPRLTIQTLGPGEVLGWSWLLPSHRWHLDARAVKETRAIVLEAAALRHAIDAHPRDGVRFLTALLPIIGQRLANTRIQLLDIHRG